MTLGALIVLVVVVAAGIYIPRRSKTQAHTPPSQPQPAAQSMAPSSPETATPTAPLPATVDQNSSSQQTDAPAMTSAAEAAKTALSNAAPAAQPRKLGGKSSGKAPAVAAALREPDKKTQPNTAPADPGTAANLEEVEHEVDQLSSRAAAVDASLDRLQQEQNNAGFGLRGDMVARQASMKNNLAKAQNAMERGDAQKAKKYEGLAQSDVEALEHFLKP
jgi:hypothetical protein